MTDAACSKVTASGANVDVMVEKIVEPMPTMIARTMSLIPDAITLPRTRSARKDVLFQSAKGMSTNPANVVSLNSMIVMKSWIARKKKASSVMTQERKRTAIITKFLKKAMGPVSLEISSSKG